jgi:hypothetical protein
MPTDETQAAIPEEFTETAGRGVQDLLTLTGSQLKRLVGTLGAFSPSIEIGLDKDEAAEIARTAETEMDTVASAIAFIGYLDAFGTEGASVLRKWLPPAASEPFDNLLDTFSPAVLSLAHRMARVKRITRAMPTFRRLGVECDLRQMNDDSSKLDFSPVAILRLELDEGETPVFQCTKEALTRLISRLERAQQTLHVLEKFANEHAGTAGAE